MVIPNNYSNPTQKNAYEKKKLNFCNDKNRKIEENTNNRIEKNFIETTTKTDKTDIIGNGKYQNNITDRSNHNKKSNDKYKITT